MVIIELRISKVSAKVDDLSPYRDVTGLRVRVRGYGLAVGVRVNHIPTPNPNPNT